MTIRLFETMTITSHTISGSNIAEVISDNIVIHHAEDGLELLGNAYYQGFDGIILHAHTLTPSFFDLKTKLAGDVLQKFSNYKMRLVIVGDVEAYTSKSLRDFIYESNKGRLVNFTTTLPEALEKLAH